jgi:hypothetical protein
LENIFHVATEGDIKHGYFGTLYDCAEYILRCEGIDARPDNDDPLESLEGLLKDSPGGKYKLDSAVNVIPLLLTPEEAKALPGMPEDLQFFEADDLLPVEHSNVCLKQMVDVLHARTTQMRSRGEFRSVSNSPFTQSVYEALLSQLS